MRAAIIKDKQPIEGLALYANYAAGFQSSESIYGVNYPRLKELAAKYDPKKVMRRAGGFKI